MFDRYAAERSVRKAMRLWGYDPYSTWYEYGTLRILKLKPS